MNTFLFQSLNSNRLKVCVNHIKEFKFVTFSSVWELAHNLKNISFLKSVWLFWNEFRIFFCVPTWSDCNFNYQQVFQIMLLQELISMQMGKFVLIFFELFYWQMMDKGSENNTKSAGFTSSKLYSVTIQFYMYSLLIDKPFPLSDIC